MFYVMIMIRCISEGTGIRGTFRHLVPISKVSTVHIYIYIYIGRNVALRLMEQ